MRWAGDDGRTRLGQAKVDLAASTANFEAIFGQSNLSGVYALELAWEKQSAVCWIDRGPSSGFLVAQDLLVTNNHVFRNEADADGVICRFNYQLDRRRKPAPFEEFDVDPAVFWTDADLDVTIVGVKGAPGAKYKPLSISRRPARMGGSAIVIQHPGGMPKQIGLGDTEIKALPEGGRLIQYLTDTLPGSSGSPIFDEYFNVIGLHHASTLTPDKNNYFRNEGISWRFILEAIPAELRARMSVDA